jgi:hypothetical protein
MDAFESVVAAILERGGYWTRTNVKVELTRAQKRSIGRPSSPRWELDVVAYKGRTNEILAVECKSFIDSRGVAVATFRGAEPQDRKRYKLFFDTTLRRVVLSALTRQLVGGGLRASRPKVRLRLAAGKVSGEIAWLQEHFRRKGWILMGPQQLRSELQALRTVGYENTTAAVVAKLLLR